MDARVTPAAVRLENISRRFGAAAAVDNVLLEIARGEIVSLVGRSGCGKSTLLRIIAGVESIDAGRVCLGGTEVDGRHFVEPELRGVGFVFQDYALFPHLCVRDNILFGLKSSQRAAAIGRVEDLTRRLGIAHLADRFPHTLSGGEQQRVALARALAPKPGIVLMDEPFSNLDQGLRERVRAETVALLRSLNATVIMVTHDPQEALSTGDRVVLMRDGAIVQCGSPYDLYDRPVNAYAAEFFSTFNKLVGICRDGRIDTVIGGIAQGIEAEPGAKVTLYIRPQAVSVSPDHGDRLARIERRIFLGDTEQLLLHIDGLETPFIASTRERLPRTAEFVKITIRPEGVLVFQP